MEGHLKDASGWSCAYKEEETGMLGMTLGSPSVAQTPDEGLRWTSREGEWAWQNH